MPHYHLSGSTFEQSEKDFLLWVRDHAHGMMSGGHDLYRNHLSGFPGGGVQYWICRPDGVAMSAELTAQVGDEALRQMLETQMEYCKQHCSLDDECLEFIARHFGLTLADRKKVMRKLTNLKSGPFGWLFDPGYVALKKRSVRLFAKMWELDQAVGQRTRFLIEKMGEVYEDPTERMTPIHHPRQSLEMSLEQFREPHPTISDEGAQIFRENILILLDALQDQANPE